MKNPYLNTLHLLGLCFALGLISCSKTNDDPFQKEETVQRGPISYKGEKASEVREETVVELLAIKNSVKKNIESHRSSGDLEYFIKELSSFRPRLEFVHMQTAMLPKKDQMVIFGNLAVATNQLEKDLLEVLSKDPGNDDLAMEIAHIRQQLAPIPLGSVLRPY